MAADLLADPSTATRAELAYRIEESVAQAGVLARLVSKAASSPALQSTLTAFAEYEATIESTSEMLAKINEGMLALDEAVDDCQRSLAGLQHAPSWQQMAGVRRASASWR